MNLPAKKILVFLITFVFIGACRYEDGPLISLRTTDRRLVGTWSVVGFEKNGISVLDEWRSQYDWRFTFFDRYSDRYFKVTNCNCHIDTADVTLTSADGSWILDNDDETQIGFGFGFRYYWDRPCDGMGLYPLISGQWIDYNILKLSNSRLWLNTTDSLENDYLVKFEKE